MKRVMVALAFAVALCAASSAAVDAEVLRRLDEALKAVPDFKHGADAGPLHFIEDTVNVASGGGDKEMRDAVEKRLVDTLSAAKSREARDVLCRLLRTIGTARAVPALEALLTDPESSSMACYALGRIEDPAAAEALYRAMGKTSGALQAGIINTLGPRCYDKAVSDLTRLLRSGDKAVAEAAAFALGDIGGARAVKALESARRSASGRMRECTGDALIACAEQYLREGGKSSAADIYEPFYSTREPKHVRIGALRGLVMSKGEQAVDLLVAAIKGEDLEFQASAIGFTRDVEGRKATKAFADLLPSLAPGAQELMLRALGERGDTAACPAIVEATKSQHEGVRVAALEALGKVGDVSSIKVLVEVAASRGGREQQVARASLVRLRGDGIDAAMADAARSGDPKERAELLRALAGRRASGVVRELLKIAKDDEDESVRREAIRALGAVMVARDLETLVGLAVRPKDPGDRKDIEEAIADVCRRIDDRDARAAPVLAALRTAPTDAKPTLVRLLVFAATPDALRAVRAATDDRDADTRDAGVRTIARWPDASPADDLLTIARKSTDRVHKVLALRGYVRMAGQSENPTAMYSRAMKLAENADDRRLVLGGLGTADSADALSLVEQYIDDRELQAEAAAAMVQIADKLRKADATRAKAAVQKALEVATDQRLRQQAQNIINDMEKYDGFILEWFGSGPYKEKGKEAGALFNIAFPPEQPDAKDVKWKKLTRGVGSWDINLEGALGGGDQCTGYVRTRIQSPEAQDARLELGSDDSIKAWLNGKLVHANNTNRGVNPAQDIVKVRLEKGWNEVMLKVTDNTGGWGFCCRVRKPDGSALDGLKVEAK